MKNNYFQIGDCNQRERFLRQARKENPHSLEYEIRLYLLQRRYGSAEKFGKNPRPDGFMRAWLDLKSSDCSSFSFFGRKRKINACVRSMESLCIPAFSVSPYDADKQSETFRLYRTLLAEEWRDFASLLIKTCLKDRNYGSVVFGMMPVKEDALLRKIRNEIDYVTRSLPASILREADCKPFRDVVLNVFFDTFSEQFPREE